MAVSGDTVRRGIRFALIDCNKVIRGRICDITSRSRSFGQFIQHIFLDLQHCFTGSRCTGRAGFQCCLISPCRRISVQLLQEERSAAQQRIILCSIMLDQGQIVTAIIGGAASICFSLCALVGFAPCFDACQCNGMG